MENRNGLKMVMKIMMENILGKLKMEFQMDKEHSLGLMEESMWGNGRMGNTGMEQQKKTEKSRKRL